MTDWRGERAKIEKLVRATARIAVRRGQLSPELVAGGVLQGLIEMLAGEGRTRSEIVAWLQAQADNLARDAAALNS